MADQRNGGIIWTETTWNPVRGCSKVSPGCANCYAERMAARFCGPGEPYHGTIADGRWTGKVRLEEDALTAPMRWRKPRRIFVCSMSDLFHPEVPDSYIGKIFGVMAEAHQHTFQVLTKRAQRMLEWSKSVAHYPKGDRSKSPVPGWPPNVWLGVTAEDQKRVDERIPLLLQTPAAVRFVSCEPLLGPVDLAKAGAVWSDMNDKIIPGCRSIGTKEINWVIVGGESGPGARPMHPDWARGLRDQCQAAGVPFLFKQWGEWGPRTGDQGVPDYAFFKGPGAECHVWRVGKKAAGRLMDGRTWDEFPK
jgi:protein gp37